jgi:predicted kinase
VIVDANFGEESRRRTFLEAAARLAVPAVFILCQSDPAVVRQRLESRRGDVSDADWAVYQQATQRWEAIGPETRELVRDVSTSGTKGQALTRVLDVLGEFSLLR